MTGTALPEALQSWVRARLGAPVQCRWVHTGQTGTQLWQVTTPELRAFLKLHPEARKYQQERRAYQQWTPYLAPCVPQLLAQRSEPPRALLLSSCPGEVVETARLRTEDEARMYWRAGRLLRRLQEVPFVDYDPLDVRDALGMRVRAWARRAEGLLETAMIEHVTEAMGEVMTSTVPLTRVPSHGDFTPRNWLIKGRGEGLELYLVDFEHAAPQPWLWDLARLGSRVWPGCPSRQRAFAEGYGRALTSNEAQILWRLALFDAAATLLWGVQHDHPEVSGQGRELFNMLAWRVAL